MPAYPAHVAFNFDDYERGREFYAAVFDWTFDDWGPPGSSFSKVNLDHDAGRRMIAAVQQRRNLLDVPTNGPEVTFAVDDVDEVARRVKASGGRILMPKATIPSVGDLVFFADPFENIVGAMRFVDPPEGV